MRWEELGEQPCSMSRTLAVVGDRWTLLILRDCFLGMSRFEQFIASSGMTRHILADRLKRLVEAGVLERRAYTTTPKRFDYVLTEKGKELAPALLTLRDWGKKHMPVRRATSA